MEPQKYASLVLALFVEIFRPADSVKGHFRSSNQVATCSWQSNHWKVEAIPR